MEISEYSATLPSGCYVEQFRSFASELDDFNERRERLVKASRDTTYRSKKVIFELHRVADCANPAAVETALRKAGLSIAEVQELIANRIASELTDDSYPRLHRAFTWGLQEYIEAVLFLRYLSDRELASIEELNQDLQHACTKAKVSFVMFLHPVDYVLGIADLSGELMRLAIGCAARGDTKTPLEVRNFLKSLLVRFEEVRSDLPELRELEDKREVFRQSLDKVVNTCFQITVRRAEFDSGLPGT